MPENKDFGVPGSVATRNVTSRSPSRESRRQSRLAFQERQSNRQDHSPIEPSPLRQQCFSIDSIRTPSGPNYGSAVASPASPSMDASPNLEDPPPLKDGHRRLRSAAFDWEAWRRGQAWDTLADSQVIRGSIRELLQNTQPEDIRSQRSPILQPPIGSERGRQRQRQGQRSQFDDYAAEYSASVSSPASPKSPRRQNTSSKQPRPTIGLRREFSFRGERLPRVLEREEDSERQRPASSRK